MNKDLSKLTKQSSIVFLGKILALILGLIFNFIAARYLGAEIYGRFMYIFTFVGFFPVLLLLGLQQGMVYFIPKFSNDEQKRNALITFSFSFVILLSLLVVITIVMLSDVIANNVLNDDSLNSLVKIMSPLIILTVISQLSLGVFRGIGKTSLYVINQDIIIPILKLIFLSLFIYLGLSIHSITFAFYLSMFIGVIYLFTQLIKNNVFTKKISAFQDYKELFMFSIPLVFTGFIALIIQKIDIMMIGFFFSSLEVGIYNIALRIGTLSGFVLIAFNMVFAPMISSLFHQNNMKQLSEMYSIITKWVLSVNLIAFSLILLLSEELMMLFGNEFKLGSTALILVAIGQVINSAVGPAGYILVMTGKPKYELITNIIIVVICVSLNLLLIPRYGIEGAAVSSFISIGSANIIRLYLVHKIYKIHPYNKGYIRVIFSITISLITVFIFKMITSFSWYFDLFIIPILLMSLTVILYYFFAMDENDKFILKEFHLKIKRNK